MWNLQQIDIDARAGLPIEALEGRVLMATSSIGSVFNTTGSSGNSSADLLASNTGANTIGTTGGATLANPTLSSTSTSTSVGNARLLDISGSTYRGLFRLSGPFPTDRNVDHGNVRRREVVILTINTESDTGAITGTMTAGRLGGFAVTGNLVGRRLVLRLADTNGDGVGYANLRLRGTNLHPRLSGAMRFYFNQNTTRFPGTVLLRSNTPLTTVASGFRSGGRSNSIIGTVTPITNTLPTSTIDNSIFNMSTGTFSNTPITSTSNLLSSVGSSIVGSSSLGNLTSPIGTIGVGNTTGLGIDNTFGNTFGSSSLVGLF